MLKYSKSRLNLIIFFKIQQEVFLQENEFQM